MNIDIEQLVDFDAGSPNDGQILVATSAKWVKTNPTTYSSVYRTNQLHDWNTTVNISNGMIPRYDSPTSKYIATTLNYLTSVSLNTKNLTDWVTPTFSNLQIPQYISSTSKFTPYTIPNFLTSVPNGSISLDNLSDVVIDTGNQYAGDILYYTNNFFVNFNLIDNLPLLTKENVRIDDLLGIYVASVPQNGDMLVYSQALSTWISTHFIDIGVGTAEVSIDSQSSRKLYLNLQSATNYYMVSSNSVFGSSTIYCNTGVYYNYASRSLNVAGYLNSSAAFPGSEIGISCTNQSSSTGSNATIGVGIASNTNSMPKIRLTTPLLETNMYIDPTTKSFVINNGTIGTWINVTSTGYVSLPTNPKFEAVLTTNRNSVTGDGTTYNIVYDYVSYRTPTSLYDTSNGRMTAPIAGVYNLSATVKMQNIQSNHTYAYIQFAVNGGSTRVLWGGSPYACRKTDDGTFMASGSCDMYLNVSDYVNVQVIVYGGSKVLNIQQDGSYYKTCTFSGHLVG